MIVYVGLAVDAQPEKEPSHMWEIDRITLHLFPGNVHCVA